VGFVPGRIGELRNGSGKMPRMPTIFKLRMQGVASTSDISRNAMQSAGFGGR